MKEKLTRLRRERQWGSYILVLAAILLTLSASSSFWPK